ncbi:MAG: DUF4388 domain-containing protein, partial [Deltaproteobacteria bacterium]
TFGKLVPNVNVTGEGIEGPLQFTPIESEFLMLVDGKNSFGEIARKWGRPIEEVRRVAEGLIARRFILLPEGGAGTSADTRRTSSSPPADGDATAAAPSAPSSSRREKPAEVPAPSPSAPSPPLREKPTGIPPTSRSSMRALPEVPLPPAEEEGKWDLDGLFHLLNERHRHRQTGLLTVENEGGEARRLYFHEGNLVTIQSEPFDPEECLGRILVREGSIAREVVEQTVPVAQETGRAIGRELLLQGRINRRALQKGIMHQIEKRLLRAFEWERGRYRWATLPGIPPQILGVNFPLHLILFNTIWRHYPIEKIRSRLSRLQDAFVTIVKDPPYAPESLKFGDLFTGFWRILTQEELPVTKILLLSNMNKTNTEKMLWVLEKLGLIVFSKTAEAEETKKRLQEIEDRVKGNARATYFEVLGVHWTCNDEEIRKGYEKSIREIDKLLENASEMEKYWLDQLREQVEEAYAKVKDYAPRQKYRKKLFSDDTYIEYCADLFQEKCESLLFTKEDYAQAIIEAKNALEIFPQKHEASALLGLATFLEGYPADPAKQREGRRILMDAYRRIPTSIIANICMGMMYKKQRKNKEAISYYQKILE